MNNRPYIAVSGDKANTWNVNINHMKVGFLIRQNVFLYGVTFPSWTKSQVLYIRFWKAPPNWSFASPFNYWNTIYPKSYHQQCGFSLLSSARTTSESWHSDFRLAISNWALFFILDLQIFLPFSISITSHLHHIDHVGIKGGFYVTDKLPVEFFSTSSLIL